LGGVKRKQ